MCPWLADWKISDATASMSAPVPAYVAVSNHVSRNSTADMYMQPLSAHYSAAGCRQTESNQAVMCVMRQGTIDSPSCRQFQGKLLCVPITHPAATANVHQAGDGRLSTEIRACCRPVTASLHLAPNTDNHKQKLGADAVWCFNRLCHDCFRSDAAATCMHLSCSLAKRKVCRHNLEAFCKVY
jgi:hypothetical protein